MVESSKLLKALKVDRKQLRRLTSTSCNTLEELFAADGEKDIREIDTKFQILADRVDRLFKLDEQVREILIEIDVPEDDLIKEFDSVEPYRERWVAITVKRNRLHSSDEISGVKGEATSEMGSEASATHKKLKHRKLPKLEPKKFDGSLKDWIGFWAMFRGIDEDGDLDPEEKFQYLLQYTKEGSPARVFLEGFPPSAENYPKAIKQMKARFGRWDLLIDLYVRELLKLVLVQAQGGGNMSLRALYDCLETQLRALESLGVPEDYYAFLLLPLVESALPRSILQLWNSERKKSQPPPDDDANVQNYVLLIKERLSELLLFLRREVENEERISLATSTFSTKGVDEEVIKHKGKPLKRENNLNFARAKIASSSMPTAAGLINVKESHKMSCIFCSGGSHSAESCVRCYDLQPDQIKRKLSEHGHCFLCFKRGHNKMKCRAVVRCVICSKRHNSVLCENRVVKELGKVEPDATTSKLEHNLSNTHHCPVLLQTLRVKLRGKVDVDARVMIDCGSQKSYATKRVLLELGYQPLRSERLMHALFGGMTKPQVHKCYKLKLASLDQCYFCNFDVLDTETICLAVPAPKDQRWLAELEQKGITLTDCDEGPIDVLIGADIAGKLWTGRREVLAGGLVAMETLLGWTLMGKLNSSVTAMCETYIAMMCTEASPSDLWRLDIIGIEDPAQKVSKEQNLMLAKEEFDKTVKILKDGRYEVQLPWLNDHPPLQRNFNLASLRFERTYGKLKNLSREKDYLDVLMDWQQEGIIEEIPKENWDIGHYLPHRAVYKEGSTTPLRPVFDASAREKGHPSLNQCLNPGPNLIEQIPPILNRFRKGKVGVIADVKRAFLNISVAPTDRDFLRFMWKDENGLRVFRHCRVVFGVCCSPFLLGAVFEHHLNVCARMSENGEFDCPQSVIDELKQSLYVDNYVGSHQDIADVDHFIEQATSVFSKACFELRGWERSNKDLTTSTETPVLGVVWDQKNDTLKLKIPNFTDIDQSKITKRTLSSASHRLFDPVGITCPVTVAPKRMFQKAALSGGGWDKLVDQETKDEILKWMKEIPSLNEVEVPRWYENYDVEGAHVSLHTFCDASQAAYASVIFMRIEHEGEVTVNFVMAKSRIAPPEKITIPRLELLAAVIGARLAYEILKDLDDIQEHIYWSDSSTALSWIQKDEPWAVFVGNRVKEIRQLTDPNAWRHIPGADNPADLPSRGCSPNALVRSRWWEGPSWLKLPKEKWPNSTVMPDEEEVLSERRKNVVMALNSPLGPESLQFAGRFSCYFRIVRIVGWIFRFAYNTSKGVRTRKTQETRSSGDLSPAECLLAERKLLKIVQTESFPHSLREKTIRRLKPQVDQNGLLRIRTKLWARKDSEDFRAPIVLSPEHPLTEMLMKSSHRNNRHIAGSGLLNLLREKYWILRGKQAVRRIVKNCATCQKVYSKNLEADTPPLPEDRVRDACIFEVIGTDLAGPLYLRDGSKVWIVIFTCAIFRALHLDLVNSQSTDDFVLALRRFISRRGRPSIIYSDNGTNFRGAANAMQTLDWVKIKAYFGTQPIEWRFNPPTGSWWGGFFERLIGLVKVLLKKNLGRARLDYSELSTLLCECEMHINERPITYVSDASDSPVPISPSMFLQEIREAGVPDLEELDSSGFHKRLRYRQKVKVDLRERFRAEYLSQLILSNDKRKETREPVVGELVLIGADNKKRLEWPLAIVVGLIPGKDGKCRVVKLRTLDGELIRPIQRVYPLEVFASEDNPPKSDTISSESGNDASPGLTQCEDRRTQQDDDSVPSPQKSTPKHLKLKTRCGRNVVLPLKFR